MCIKINGQKCILDIVLHENKKKMSVSKHKKKLNLKTKMHVCLKNLKIL